MNKARALARLFDFLEAEAIEYCVLGDYRDLPSAIEGDVDIAVSAAAYRRAGDWVQRFARSIDWQWVQALEHERCATYFVLAEKQDEQNPLRRPQFLHLDICSDYVRFGAKIMGAGELLASPRQQDGMRCAGAAENFAYYWVKKVGKGELNQEAGAFLSREWQEDPEGSAAYMARFLSTAHDREAISDAAQSGDWVAIRSELPRFNRVVRKRFGIGGRWRELLRRGRRVLRPTGIHLALYGPDGSGKSTVIDGLQQWLAPGFRQTRSIHLRPGALKNRGAKTVASTTPHAQKPRGLVLSVVKLFYFAGDYVVGYFTKVRPLLVRSTLVIFDRYYHDLCVDPIRFRYGGPAWLARLVGRVVPRPSMSFVLDAPTEVLRARKEEVPLAETERQRKAYRTQIPQARFIDTHRPVEAVLAEISHAVLEHMARRPR